MRPLALRHDETHHFVLYFTKGLGDVVAAEVKEITPIVTVVKEGERFLIVALPTADAVRLGRGWLPVLARRIGLLGQTPAIVVARPA